MSEQAHGFTERAARRLIAACLAHENKHDRGGASRRRPGIGEIALKYAVLDEDLAVGTETEPAEALASEWARNPETGEWSDTERDLTVYNPGLVGAQSADSVVLLGWVNGCWLVLPRPAATQTVRLRAPLYRRAIDSNDSNTVTADVQEWIGSSTFGFWGDATPAATLPCGAGDQEGYFLPELPLLVINHPSKTEWVPTSPGIGYIEGTLATNTPASANGACSIFIGPNASGGQVSVSVNHDWGDYSTTLIAPCPVALQWDRFNERFVINRWRCGDESYQ